ncbi:MAG: hypothetical protein ABSH10_06990 [Phycisphaerae bacterium]
MPRFSVMMIKLVRFSGWLALVVLAVQFGTVAVFVGWAPAAWMNNAMAIHTHMALPIFVVLLLHVSPATYLAIRRWTQKRIHPQT